jgi:hypothetical protein
MTFPRDKRPVLPMVPQQTHSEDSLTGVVASIRDAVFADRRSRGLPVCRVTLDLSDDHVPAVEASLLREILEPLLGGAIARSAGTTAHRSRRSDAPSLHEVVVTSIASVDAIEIEVADSCPGPARLHDATAVGAPLERVGGTITATHCPEGGTAFTVRLPRRRQNRMAA